MSALKGQPLAGRPLGGRALAGRVLGSGGGAGPATWPGGGLEDYTYRAQITLPVTAVTESDYVFLLDDTKLTSQWTAGQKTDFFGQILSSGADIAFTTDAARTTKLARDVFEINAASEKLCCAIKANSAASAVLWMYWGDPDTADVAANTAAYPATWRVFAADAANDRTSAANNGIPTGTTTTTGEICTVRDFNGTSDLVDFGDLEFGALSAFSLLVSFNVDSAPVSNTRVISKDRVGTPGAFVVQYVSALPDFRFQIREPTLWEVASVTEPSAGAWHNVAATFNGATEITLRVDGGTVITEAISASNIDDSDNEEIVLGADSNTATPAEFFDGKIGLFVIAYETLSTNFTKQWHDVIATPGFYTIGAPASK